MSIWPRILILGASAGAVGGGLACIASATWPNGNVIGAVLAVGSGSLAGGAGAYLAVGALRRAVVSSLADLERPDSEGRLATGCTEIDVRCAALAEVLARGRQVQLEITEVERIARSVWTAFHDGESGQSGAFGLRQNVVGLLGEFRRTAARLIEDASSLDEAAAAMATGAIDQSETVSRTTTTVEALSDRIDRISQNAEEAADACEKARDEARRGLVQVHTVIEGMDRLRAQVEANGRKARRLGDRSVEIGTMVELIKGISSRTDMLALNATIESVRAGEHGRGFAVVAEEIRKLAERTAAATREIGTLVEAIQADTHESLRALGEEQTDMDREAQRVREAGAALERISVVAEDSARLVDGISRSTNDQVLATQDLVRAMQRISAVSHQTHEGTAQARAAISAMTRCCDPLRRLTLLELGSPSLTSFEPRTTHNGNGHGNGTGAGTATGSVRRFRPGTSSEPKR